jgi:hypothetical protein
MPRSWHLADALLVLTLSGCGAIEEREGQLHIERFSELLIVDDELLRADGDPARDLPGLVPVLSGLLALDASDTSPLLAWLEGWQAASDHSAQFQGDVTCRWLRATPENRCTDDCASCAERTLAPDAAPFRLIGIAYRPDLALATGNAPGQAQLRLVYALTLGPASAAESPELSLSMILELPLSDRLEPAQWAADFHALAALRSDVAAYRRALRARVEAARAVQTPERVSLRIRDASFSAGRMLAWAPRGTRLTRIGLENTVDLRTPEATLEATLASQAPHDSPQTLEVPAALWADTVDAHSSWPNPSDKTLRQTLRLISCHGCHAEDHSTGGFHVAPGQLGRARVSSFLHRPEAPEGDELSRREDALRTLLVRSELD